LSIGTGPIRTKSQTFSSQIINPLPTKVYTYPGGVLISSTPNQSFSGPESTGSIAYSTRPEGSCIRSPAYCRHSKRILVYSGSESQYKTVLQPSVNPFQRVEYGGYHLHSYAAHAAAESLALSQLPSTGVAVLGAGAQSWINQTFLDLRPDLTTMSLPNFLLEIEDIRGLFQLWKRNVGILRNLAGGRLNYKFGWKPTYGDLESAIDGLRHMSDTIEAFEKAAGVVQRRQESLLNDNTTVSGTFLYQGNSLHPCSWTATLNRHVQGFLVFKPQPFEVVGNLNKSLRGFLDTLGVELNPRIIWDAIPFTFVIDWFFGIGGFLDQFKFDTLRLPILCTDSFLQYKETLTVHSQLTLDRNSPISSPEVECPPWASRSDFFHRIPINPNDDIVFNLGWRRPSGSQLVNLASLAVVLSPSRWIG